MIISKKILRYYWWISIEFLKKYFKLIIISFTISFILLIAVISISPYLETFLPKKKEIIGIVGNFDLNNPPEDITEKISNGLLFVNEKGELIPLLVSFWEKKDNGRHYRFYIKKNLFWSDGNKFDSSDIGYQFKDVRVKIIDDHTIDFYLEKPLDIFPTYLNKPLIRYPLIGIGGLYKAVNIKEKNGYITSVDLIPQKKDIPLQVYKFFKNENQMINAYKKGEITKMKVTKKNVAEQFFTWKNTKVTKTVDYNKLLTLFYNENNQILKSKSIKEAISMAIDYQKIGENGEIAKGPIPPTSWSYNQNLKDPLFNPQLSEKIIKNEITTTEEAKLNLVTYYEYYDIADEIVMYLNKVGLKINLTILNYEKYSNFDLLLALWKVPKDPDQYYFWHSTQKQSNIGKYKNIKVDKLLEDGRSNLNPKYRRKIYLELQRVIQDNPPALFLYYPYTYNIERR